MLRKSFNLLFLIMISFFISILPSKALDVDIKTIGEAIDQVSPTTQSVYVIGSYIFTTEHTLTTQDMMLTAKSIKLKDTVGKTNQDNVYNEMTIFKLSREYNDQDEATGNWIIEKSYIGSAEFPSTLTIRYVDYKKILNTYHITLNYDDGTTPNGNINVTEGTVPTEPTKPERKGYVFDGWYLDGELFEFDETIDGDITLVAHWKEAVDFEELLNIDAETFTSDDYSAIFEEETLSINVNNKYRKIADADLNVLVKLVDKLLENDKVTSVILNYNNSKYEFTKSTPADEKTSTIENLLDALATSPAGIMLTSVNPDARFASTLEKEFTISVTLKDGVALTENSKELYKVKFVSNAKDAVVETDLTDGFKGETSEFTVTLTANDYEGEMVWLVVNLPESSYSSLQYCKTDDSCEDFNGKLGTDLDLELADATYKFKVTWKETGSVAYDIKVVDVIDSEGIVYAEAKDNVTIKEKFDVTFDYADDTTEEKTVQVVSGELVPEPDKPTREHYKFLGWFNGETEYTFDEPLTESLELTAHWVGETYTATFAGVSAEEYPPQKVVYPDTVQKPEKDPTQDGHDFTGWFVDNVEYTFDEPLTGDITINAVFDKQKKTVKFYSDGSMVKEETVLYEELAPAPELTKEGHKITKWTKSQVGGDEFDITSTPVTENLDLYANWEAIKYTFKYVGEEITEPEKEYTYPELPEEPNPERKGYTFEGWFLEDASEKYDFKTKVLEEKTITLTAHWKANTYTVTYVCEDCDRTYAEEKYTYPNKPAAPIAPTKTGYDFKYWYDQDDEEQTEYNFTTSELLKDLTLVAKFDTKKYYVDFDLKLPQGVTDDQVKNKPTRIDVEYNKLATEPDPEPEVEGYDFLGWYTQYPTVSDVPFDFEKTTITKNYTLIAKWKKKTYTVTFKANDEVIKSVSDVEHGRTVNQRLKDNDMKDFILSPYKEGHRFDHWYLETDEKQDSYSFDTEVKGDITLVAKFVPVVNIDNIVGDAALKVKNGSFLASYANKVITINVDDGDGDHATAHNDESIKTLVESDSASVVKVIKELVDNENIQSVKMSYANNDYDFTGDETALKAKLVELLTAIVQKNNSTYDTATLNELIENNYSENPLTLTITLKEGVETVEGQNSPATYNIKVDSNVVTVTNETELKNALNDNYESIKIGQTFSVSDTIDINRSVNIFGKSYTIETTNSDANTIFNIRHNSVAGGTTVNIKNLTLKGGKKGIYIGEKSTTLYITNLTFEDQTDMAMEINGKLHADGTFSYNKEDYNHPFVRTPRENAVTGGTYSNAKETENIQIHDAYLDYEYEIIHKYADVKYTDDDFKIKWEGSQKVIGEDYCEDCKAETGALKQEYQELIGTPYINHSDSAEKTGWSHYYLNKEHSQFYVVIFKDTPSAALIWRYVLDGETPVIPRDPLPTDWFKSFAKNRTIKVYEDGQVTDKTVTYKLEGWSDDSKGTTKNYELDGIKGATQNKYYYTYYVKVEE